MDIREMRRQVEDAKQTLENVDNIARSIAPLLVGRLRKCNIRDLELLKKELRDYNIKTGQWKDLGDK